MYVDLIGLYIIPIKVNKKYLILKDGTIIDTIMG